MEQYKALIDRILTKSQEQEDRTGVGTVFLFGESIEFDLQTGFPIVSLRDIAYKSAFGELAAFLRGATSKQEFTDLGCSYWNTTGEGDDLGPIYGAQWRNWGGYPDRKGIDQLRQLVINLKVDPTSRRNLLSTWNIGEMPDMVLPPCHLTAQFNVHKGCLDCAVYMRSVDVMLGLPYDIIVYALLTHLLAKHCGYKVGMLKFMMGNTHIYKNHYMDAIRLLKLEPQKHAPQLSIVNAELFDFFPQDAIVTGYEPNDKMAFKLNL